MKKQLFVASLGSVLACTLPVDPITLHGVSVDFEVVRVGRDWDVSSPVISSDPGSVLVQGTFVAPTGGYELSPTISTDPEMGLVLTIHGEQVAPGITVPILHDFKARVTGLAPGRYRATLRYTWDYQETHLTAAQEVIVVR